MKAILCWRDNHGREGRGTPISLKSAIDHIRLMKVDMPSVKFWYEAVEPKQSASKKKEKQPC